MDGLSLTLLKLALACYVTGAVAGLLFLRAEKLANFFTFGCASLAASCGLVSSVLSLATGAARGLTVAKAIQTPCAASMLLRPPFWLASATCPARFTTAQSSSGL